MTATLPARRRDAQLNRAQILSVSLRELNANPDVSVEEIAKAAGVVRRTVYGHFPTREALLDALAEAVAAEVADLADETSFNQGDPTLTLASFTLAVWQLRDRYRSFPVVARRAGSGARPGNSTTCARGSRRCSSVASTAGNSVPTSPPAPWPAWSNGSCWALSRQPPREP